MKRCTATLPALLLALVVCACASTDPPLPSASQASTETTNTTGPPAFTSVLDADSGFNAATVETFARSISRFELAGLSKVDAQRLDSLREIGDSMRALGSRDLQSLVRTLGPQSGPVVRALGTDGRGAQGLIWPAFFQSSVVAIGNGRSNRAEVALYNPFVDGWLITQWRLDGRRWSLAGAVLSSGESVRGQKPELVPAWQAADASIAVAMPQSFAATISAYERARPRYEVAAAPPLSPVDPRETAIIRARVAEMRVGVLRFAADQAAAGAMIQLLAAIRRGRAAGVKALIARPVDDAVNAALALDQNQRDALLPFVVFTRRDGGRSVALITRSESALVILVEYGTGASAARIESLSVITIAAAGT